MKTIKTIQAAKAADTAELLAACTTSGKALSLAENKVKKARVKAWPYTVSLFINGSIPCEGTAAEVMDSVRDCFVDNIDTEILNSVSTNKKDELMFRSDPATKDLWKFASSVSRAIAVGITYADMFEAPELEGNIPSKGFIEKLTSDQKSNLEKLEAILTTARAVIENMANDSKADREKAEELCSDLAGTVGSLS